MIRLGGVAALTGGLLRIAAAFIPYVPDSPWLEGFYALIDASLLLGLIGLFAVVSDRTSALGLAGFAIAVIGQGSIIGPDATQFGIDFYLVGSLILLAGLALLSIDMLRARMMRPAAALWLLAVGLAGASAVVGQMAVLAAGVAFGAAFAWAGAMILAGPAADRHASIASIPS
jgi:hypothetical protein